MLSLQGKQHTSIEIENAYQDAVIQLSFSEYGDKAKKVFPISIKPGNKENVIMSSGNCVWDMQVKLSDGTHHEILNVDFCSVEKITLGNDLKHVIPDQDIF